MESELLYMSSQEKDQEGGEGDDEILAIYAKLPGKVVREAKKAAIDRKVVFRDFIAIALMNEAARKDS